MKDTFTLWGLYDREHKVFAGFEKHRRTARDQAQEYAKYYNPRYSVVKLSCQIVPQKPKRKKHNFGLPLDINPALKGQTK